MRTLSFRWPFVVVALGGLAIAGPAADPPTRLRVMTFNIRYGTAKDGQDAWDRRRDFLAERVRAADPDLLGVQEALADQIDFLAERLPGYRVVGVGRDDGKRGGEFSAIYLKTSRVTATDTGTFWLSETPDKVGSKSWDSALPRVVSWAKLTVAGRPNAKLVYMNTHWDHRGPRARLESAKVMRRWARDHAAGLPLVMTGDLNCREPSEPFQYLLRGEGADPAWTDSFRAAHPKAAPDEEGTFHGFQGHRNGPRIDYILHTKHFRTVEAAVDRTRRDGRAPSDHDAVTATLEF